MFQINFQELMFKHNFQKRINKIKLINKITLPMCQQWSANIKKNQKGKELQFSHTLHKKNKYKMENQDK